MTITQIGGLLLLVAIMLFVASCLFPDDHEDHEPVPAINNICYHLTILLLGASLMAFLTPMITAA